MLAAAKVMRSPTARMAAPGWARGSLPAQVCGPEKVCWIWTPWRAQVMKATEPASAFRTPCQSDVLPPSGAAAVLCSRTCPSWWVSAQTAWPLVRPGRTRMRRADQIVVPQMAVPGLTPPTPWPSSSRPGALRRPARRPLRPRALPGGHCTQTYAVRFPSSVPYALQGKNPRHRATSAPLKKDIASKETKAMTSKSKWTPRSDPRTGAYNGPADPRRHLRVQPVEVLPDGTARRMENSRHQGSSPTRTSPVTARAAAGSPPAMRRWLLAAGQGRADATRPPAATRHGWPRTVFPRSWPSSG